MHQDSNRVASAEARTDKGQRLLLLLILLVAFTARFGLAAYRGLDAEPDGGSDEHEIDVCAWNLARGQGYRGMSADVADQSHLTAWRPPGASIMWAAVYAAVGHRFDAVRVVNCIFSTLSVWLVYRLGRRAFNDTVGIVAAASYAVFPLAVLQSTELLSEPLGVFLFLLFLDLTMGFAASPTWGRAIAAGAILGLALLTRSNYATMIPLVGVWAIWQFRGKWTNAVRALAILAVAGVVLTPWVVRNYYVFGEFIPFSTAGGAALLQGNNRIVVTDPKRYGYNVWDTQIPEYREALQTAGSEVERDRRAKRFAIQWLAENKDKWGFLLWHKLIRSWTPFLTHNPSAAHRWLYLLTWGPVLILFCVALIPTFVKALRSGTPEWLLHLAILHYAVNSLVFFAFIRYRAPVEPLCLILAAWTVAQVWGLLWGGKRQEAPRMSSTH